MFHHVLERLIEVLNAQIVRLTPRLQFFQRGLAIVFGVYLPKYLPDLVLGHLLRLRYFSFSLSLRSRLLCSFSFSLLSSLSRLRVKKVRVLPLLLLFVVLILLCSFSLFSNLLLLLLHVLLVLLVLLRDRVQGVPVFSRYSCLDFLANSFRQRAGRDLVQRHGKASLRVLFHFSVLPRLRAEEVHYHLGVLSQIITQVADLQAHRVNHLRVVSLAENMSVEGDRFDQNLVHIFEHVVDAHFFRFGFTPLPGLVFFG
mmetsp:Transcript_71877/g.163163  ORF Transcript_71877/g.163163 Transcript_71877/m.163163 type:complete len:256 (+) Transcript_71877:1362-2129(+)